MNFASEWKHTYLLPRKWMSSLNSNSHDLHILGHIDMDNPPLQHRYNYASYTCHLFEENKAIFIVVMYDVQLAVKILETNGYGKVCKVHKLCPDSRLLKTLFKKKRNKRPLFKGKISNYRSIDWLLIDWLVDWFLQLTSNVKHAVRRKVMIWVLPLRRST